MDVFHGKWAVDAAVCSVNGSILPYRASLWEGQRCNCLQVFQACFHCQCKYWGWVHQLARLWADLDSFWKFRICHSWKTLNFPIPPWLKNSSLSPSHFGWIKSPVQFLLRPVTALSQGRSWLTVGDSILLHQISPVLACRNQGQYLLYPWIFFQTLESDSLLVLV